MTFMISRKNVDGPTSGTVRWRNCCQRARAVEPAAS